MSSLESRALEVDPAGLAFLAATLRSGSSRGEPRDPLAFKRRSPELRSLSGREETSPTPKRPAAPALQPVGAE